ncbi:energy transducer TonB [Thioalkalivibrio paradoxus]|uniref:Biopolymer transporter TonB n=1 Tax=Thioalkalivibrio paradoxus ARh 1 TaxID=713585 RepID=W0DRQ3_9GAMM|nr:energy transducer TonB [Thioalkalivibrio paradoxus]AHE99540.1 biopolymer transporter TonB [Thioalkalivibrio paradoxus ARh 1]
MSATLPRSAPVESNRLTLPLFLALVLHALVILGVGFEMLPEERPAEITLDVTWVDAPAPEPEHAEHVAPRPQEASGDADQDRMAQTPEPVGERPADPAPAGDAGLIPEPIEMQLEASDPAPERQPDPVVAHADDAPPAPMPEEPSPTDTTQPPEQPSAALLMARGLEAARSMPAETEQTLLSRATRTRYLDTLAARGAPEAAYLEAWIRKVERIGNLNYPDEARRRGLSGTLVLSVRLDADGRVLDIAVAQSSGESILDQAAIRIVELAQPFAPFTESMRESYDQLVITRTWAFRRDRVERVR